MVIVQVRLRSKGLIQCLRICLTVKNDGIKHKVSSQCRKQVCSGARDLIVDRVSTYIEVASMFACSRS
jgi:hypothetical protein